MLECKLNFAVDGCGCIPWEYPSAYFHKVKQFSYVLSYKLNPQCKNSPLNGLSNFDLYLSFIFPWTANLISNNVGEKHYFL